MTVYVDDPDFTLHLGDVRNVLPTLPAESVDCAVTSPPFYALRDYGTGEWEGGAEGCDHLKVSDVEAAVATSTLGGGKKTTGHLQEGYGSECGKCGARRIDRQIGLEATPDEWAAELVGVFREVRRVLKPEGTLWVECGDSYSSSPPGNKGTPDEAYKSSGLAGAVAGSRYMETLAKSVGQKRDTSRIPGIKPKDLIGAPWLLAFALRADGWYLRQAIFWHKPNAMPESVRDRCTTAHSYVFLLSKQPRYWFDADAIAEPAEWARWGDQTTPKYEGTETSSGWMQPKTKAELIARGGRTTNGQRERTDEMRGFDNRLDRADGMKNARSVWAIPTSGYAEAHFATFPEALVERMLLAGCPEWVCAACGKARERVTEDSYRSSTYGNSTRPDEPGSNDTDGKREAQFQTRGFAERKLKTSTTVGWSDCGCNAGWIPGTCLDPFMGSGTTAFVARRLGRRSIGVELNTEYAAMAARRLQQLSLLA